MVDWLTQLHTLERWQLLLILVYVAGTLILMFTGFIRGKAMNDAIRNNDYNKMQKKRKRR